MNFEIEKLVPRFLLRDKNGYALAKAIEAGLNDMCAIVDRSVKTLQDVETAPEWRLDELAWEYGAEWYDYDADLETKRAQIEGVRAFYNRLGTPYAVVSALEAVYGNGFVEEWFDYGAEAYHYRVLVTDEKAVTEYRERVTKLLNIVSNVRSVLDGIVYYGAQGTANSIIMTAAAGVDGSMTGTAQ